MSHMKKLFRKSRDDLNPHWNTCEKMTKSKAVDPLASFRSLGLHFSSDDLFANTGFLRPLGLPNFRRWSELEEWVGNPMFWLQGIESPRRLWDWSGLFGSLAGSFRIHSSINRMFAHLFSLSFCLDNVIVSVTSILIPFFSWSAPSSVPRAFALIHFHEEFGYF